MLNRRALMVTGHGGLDVLRIADGSLADPGPDEVQVRVAASGINFMDVYQRQGIYPTVPPFALGSEGAGTVSAVGSAVGDIAIGDVVAWATAQGSHAEFVNVLAANAVPVPRGLDPALAAAAMLQGMTAHYLVTSTFPITAGQSALVHAAAGGVGQLLVQLIKARGARVIATASTEGKCDIASSCGADVVIQYGEVEDLAAAVRASNDDRGVDVVYDGVGKDTFDASLASLRPRGLLALFGASSGQVPPFEIQRLNYGGSLFLTRPTMRDYLADRAELLWRSGEILTAVADGRLRIDIGARFALDDAVDAYAALEGRKTTGKVLLIP